MFQLLRLVLVFPLQNFKEVRIEIREVVSFHHSQVKFVILLELTTCKYHAIIAQGLE